MGQSGEEGGREGGKEGGREGGREGERKGFSFTFWASHEAIFVSSFSELALMSSLPPSLPP